MSTGGVGCEWAWYDKHIPTSLSPPHPPLTDKKTKGLVCCQTSEINPIGRLTQAVVILPDFLDHSDLKSH